MFCKEGVLKVLQNSPENTFDGGHACKFIKKDTTEKVLSCKFCEISKKPYFYRTHLVAASMYKFCFLRETF